MSSSLARRLDTVEQRSGLMRGRPIELTEEQKAEEARRRAHIATLKGGKELLAAMDAAPPRYPIDGILNIAVCPTRGPVSYEWTAIGDPEVFVAGEGYADDA